MLTTAAKLIDELIDLWEDWKTQKDYYLSVLLPNIVQMDDSLELSDAERTIVNRLHEILTQGEWKGLPRLVEDRLDGNPIEVAYDREQEKKRREAEERERIRIEREEAEKELERQRLREEREKRADLQRRIREVLKHRYLVADAAFSGQIEAGELSSQEFDDLKTEFVRDWSNSILPRELANEQAAAVADTAGDVQVVARAGSGKTRTLISRAIFLQKHCGVSPTEMLLLAFNRDAAEEMKDRIAQIVEEDLPHVMTFHALAYALVHPEEDIIFDSEDADQFGLSHEVQEVINEHLISPEYRQLIQGVMLAHFRDDWERIVEGGFHLTMAEFLDHRRSLPRESLNGDYVKSFGDKAIANALFENSVEYKYERNFRWNGVNYRPDFTIPMGSDGGVVIEYFGLRGDPDYDEMTHQKREFWAGHRGWTLIEVSPDDLASKGEESFVRYLLDELQKLGIPHVRRTDEEIWELIKDRAVDRFTQALTMFIGRSRKLNLSIEKLKLLIDDHKPCSRAEELFLDVGVSVYQGYLERLADAKKQDFDGLMWQAVSLIRDGETRFVRDRGRERGDLAKLRFVMIDEFQDFSLMFYKLIDAIHSINSETHFFCVGDDWQAINGFAGSDLEFFNNFSDYFPGGRQCRIRNNYRSAKTVVEVGNALMNGLGTSTEAVKSKAGWVRLCKLDEFRPSPLEQARHRGDEITPALLRLIRHLIDHGLDIVILSRKNHVPWYFDSAKTKLGKQRALDRFLEHIRSFLPEHDRDRISISTVHRYKGLDSSAVVLLDAIRRSFPLVHPNWVFTRVFGDDIQKILDDERRLFYVAVSRAENSLAILTETSEQSPFIDDISGRISLAPIKWEALPAVPSLDGSFIEIRVLNAYEIKETLKEIGYRWEPNGKYWHVTLPGEGFSFVEFTEQSWINSRVRIEVYSETGELIHSR